jgi:hypothetical protein
LLQRGSAEGSNQGARVLADIDAEERTKAPSPILRPGAASFVAKQRFSDDLIA